MRSQTVISLDGAWLLACDPENCGVAQHWYQQPPPETQAAKVPWIIQDTFPGYHGLAWYWQDLIVPLNPHAQGRYLLRFWAVDYKADVWVNGLPVGGHEGGETPFVLDVTEAIKPGCGNRVAVRVLNPTHQRIDGIVLNETPHRCKVMPFGAGAGYNHGGIVDSVELLLATVVYIDDLCCRADPNTGLMTSHATVRNAGQNLMRASLAFTVAPATGGSTLHETHVERDLPPGDTTLAVSLPIASPHLWDLHDPYLYRVTLRLRPDRSELAQELAVRCGFRDFRFESGYFRLNGRRLFLRCSHTCNHYPIGLQFPHDPDLARRDLLNAKAMGFNTVRFIWGGAMRSQLDLCDEIGLLVYQESHASQPMAVSDHMAERFDRAVFELIRRDRNHPCIVIWGLLNETPNGPVFQHAVSILPRLRTLDASRLVMLNSGRWDGQLDIGSLSNPGSTVWQHALGDEQPGATPTKMAWPDGYCARVGDVHAYPRVPHTAPTIQFLRTLGCDTARHVFLSEYGIGSAVDLWRTVRQYERLGKEALEDARFYRDKLNRFLADWEGWHLEECFDRPEDFFEQSLRKMAGQRSLGLNAIRANPNLVGYSLTGLIDHVMTGEGLTTPFREFKPGTMDAISEGWASLRLCLFVEPVHIYAGTRVKLEAVLANEDVLKAGEYAIGLRVVGPNRTRIFERTVTLTIPDRQSQPELPLALPVFSQEIVINGPSGKYRFLATMEKGGAPTGGQTEFFVAAPMERHAVIDREITLWGKDDDLAHWLSDQGFRVRPFTPDARIAREVILVSPTPAAAGGRGVFQELVQRIASGAVAVFSSPNVFHEIVGGDVRAETSATAQHFVTPFDAEFEAANVPKEEQKYFSRAWWGDFSCAISGLSTDSAAADYVVELGISEGYHTEPNARLFDVAINGQVVLKNFDIVKEAGGRCRPVMRRFPARAEGGRIKIDFIDRKAGAALSRLRVYDRGHNLVVEHSALAHQGYGAFPFAEVGMLDKSKAWGLYLQDEWAKNHPIFAGLPAGGLMDYAFYREIISDVVLVTHTPPAEAVAGAIKASQDYATGLLVSVHNWGNGRFILNTLSICENMRKHPVADQLLRNMLNYAARPVR